MDNNKCQYQNVESDEKELFLTDSNNRYMVVGFEHDSIIGDFVSACEDHSAAMRLLVQGFKCDTPEFNIRFDKIDATYKRIENHGKPEIG